MPARKKFDAVCTIGTYKDRETGEEKKRYANVGTVFENEDGRLSLKLETVPVGPGWSGYIQFFEPRSRDGQRPAPRQEQRPAPRESDQESDDDGDDIPFDMSDITKETPQTNAVWQRHLGMTPKCCADALELAMKLERKNAKLREHARMSSVCRELKIALDKALAENLAMRDAIRQFQRAKGRHNTEIAARRIMEMEIN